jgi:hypothetical protein
VRDGEKDPIDPGTRDIYTAGKTTTYLLELTTGYC